MISSKVRKSLVFACVAGLLASGCSPGGGGANSEERSDFVRQANAVCRTANRDINALFETDFPAIQEKIPDFFVKAAPVVKSRSAGLRAIEPPEADRPAFDKMLQTSDKVVADFEASATDVKKGVEIFSGEGGENDMQFQKQAKALGLDRCAEDEEQPEEEARAKTPDSASFSAEKNAYIESADKVCKKANEEFKKIEERVFAEFPPTMKAWADGIPDLVANGRSQVEGLRAIEPPAADKAEITKILDDQAAGLAEMEAARAKAQAGDAEGFNDAVSSLFPRFDEADAALRDYGFKECGSEA